MQKVQEWVPYDNGNKDANPLPPRGQLVWVHDAYYHGVTVGEWVGWWEVNGSDDVGITHWMPMEIPSRPVGFGTDG